MLMAQVGIHRPFGPTRSEMFGPCIPSLGSITRDELKEWMTRHGRFLTRRQVAMMIDAVDINDDGEIDYSEFLVSSLTQPYKKPRP